MGPFLRTGRLLITELSNLHAASPMAKRNFPEGTFDTFITARCCNQDWFRVPLQEVWNIFSSYLHLATVSWHFRVRGFVLMANHYHLIVTSDREALPPAMNYLQRECAREINRGCGRINQVWGRPYHSTVIKSYRHWMNAYKYLYRNPVKAGICERVEEYLYSAIRIQLGFEHSVLPVGENPLQNDVEGTLAWLNRKPDLPDYDKLMKQALSRPEMRFGKNKNSKPSRFESEIF